MLGVRAFLFYFCLALVSVYIGFCCLFIWVLPYKVRAPIILVFNRSNLFFLRLMCGVTCEIRGQENIPKDTPFVVMSKHQSTWETFFLQVYFRPLATILKRELLKIPCFGWGLAMMRPIAIDRSNPRAAIKTVKEKGVARLKMGMNVLVFPEGTRTPLGEVGNYARSGADIAIAAGVPVLPIAHNAGLHWPMHTWKKNPGTIVISIGPPILPTGQNSREMTEAVKSWIESEVKTLPSSLPTR